MARIAIVDDSRLARTYASTVVRKAGHESIEIDPISLFEVLKGLRETLPEILIMDYLMPGCPAQSLARACREDPALQNMKILVCTAHHDDEIQTRLERLGVAGFLHKPIEPSALLAAIEGLTKAEG